MRGLLISTTIAMASMFVSEHYGGPVMLYALLLGMAFHFLAQDVRFQPGIEFSASAVLKTGVALIGLRITLGQIADLGWPTIALVLCALTSTLVIGWVIGRLAGLTSDHAVLSAGAVAICGASAALAISAILPRHDKSEQNTVLTIVGVTALSTIAMVVYPMIADFAGFSDTLSGKFIGASVHDVAQVVGAGYSISASAGDTSAIVKLMRVACLAPVVLTLALLFRRGSDGPASDGKVAILPVFVIAFIACVVANSIGLVPALAIQIGTEISRWCLIIAIAAIGCKTSLATLVDVGLRPILVLTAQSAFLAIFMLVGLLCFF